MMQWAWRKVTPVSTEAEVAAPTAVAATVTVVADNDARQPSVTEDEYGDSTARRGGLTAATQIAGPRLAHRGTAAIPMLKRHSANQLHPTSLSAPVLVPSPRRRAPVSSIFPVVTHQASGQLRTHPPLIRTGSIFDDVKGEYMETLHALFHVCDLNGDGKISPTELDVLLQLIGLAPSETAQFLSRRFPTINVAEFKASTIARIGLTFDQVLKECRTYIVTCAAYATPPSSTFIAQCKPLKLGFCKCDSDNTGELTKTELEIALQKLEYFLTDRELDAFVGILDRNSDGFVEWSDFVHAAWTNSLAELVIGEHDTLSIVAFADLPLLLLPAAVTDASSNRNVIKSASAQKTVSSPRLVHVDTRTPSVVHSWTGGSSDESKATSKSRIERMGVDFLTHISMARVAHAKCAAVMPHAKPPSHHCNLSRQDTISGHRQLSRQETVSGHRHSFSVVPGSSRLRSARRTGFSSAVRRRIQHIEVAAVAIAVLLGIVSGLVSLWLEGELPDDLEARHGSFVYFVCVLFLNIAVSLVEVNGMYVTAVVCAFRITVCTNLTLYPQDAEREFLTRAIARAALQVGHRTDKIFGIDPMRDSPRVVLLLSYVVYKTKRYMLKFLLKLFIKRVLWRAAAKSVLSLLVLPINGVMNAWTLHNVMRNCRVSIIGPPSVLAILEVFFLDDDSFAPYQRVDYVRVMGCSLVCKRSVHPNLEIMLDHMRHRWIHPERWPVGDGCICLAPDASDDCCPLHPLDDTTRFLGSMELYASYDGVNAAAGLSTKEHLRYIFLLLIVALIIDGNLDWAERKLYFCACTAARVQKRWSGVVQLKRDFVQGKGIHVASVYALIVDEIAVDGQDALEGTRNAPEMPRQSVSECLRYAWTRISRFVP